MREDAEGGRPSAPEARVDALPLIQLNQNVVTEKMGAEVVFVHLRTNRIYTLNATAARAWELLSEGHSTGLDVVHKSFDERDTNWPHVVLRRRDGETRR